MLECAHALGYVPNAVARGLATRSTWVSVRTHEVAADGGRFELDLPPHSFSCLEVSLG